MRKNSLESHCCRESTPIKRKFERPFVVHTLQKQKCWEIAFIAKIERTVVAFWLDKQFMGIKEMYKFKDIYTYQYISRTNLNLLSVLALLGNHIFTGFTAWFYVSEHHHVLASQDVLEIMFISDWPLALTLLLYWCDSSKDAELELWNVFSW